MNRMETVRKALKLLARHKRRFVSLLVVTSVGALLSGVGDPVALKLLIDSMSAGNIRAFVVLAALLLVLFTSIRLIRWWSAMLVQQLKNRVYEDLTVGMFRIYFRIPYHKLDKGNGYYISRIGDEPLEVTGGVDRTVQLVSAVMVLVGALVVCLWLSWKISVVLFIIVPILLYLADKYGSRISDTADEEKEAQAQMREGLGRSVESYKTVNVFGLHGAVNREMNRRLQSYLSLLYARVKYSSAFQAVSGLCLSYAEMAVLIGTGIQVIQGNLTIGGLFAFTSAYWRVVASFRSITNMVPDLARLGSQIRRIEEFHLMATGVVEAPDHDSIEFAHASFSFDGNRILRDFDLSIRLGETVLLTGPNGSGKSTLTHILAGFLTVDGGEAALPGLGRMSCLLLPFGFIPGTLKDNVDYENLPSERRVRFQDLVERFGLGEKLDRDPASLSEGEKRKFEVILTLTKDADFYVFDEPLAHVDLKSKSAVMEAIRDLTRGKTLLVIMHGEEEFRSWFDREVVLDAAPIGAEFAVRKEPSRPLVVKE